MKTTAFVLPPKLAERVEKLREAMGYDDSANVITRAIELLDLSVGRDVILQEKNRSVQISDLKNYTTTCEITPDVSSPQ